VLEALLFITASENMEQKTHWTDFIHTWYLRRFYRVLMMVYNSTQSYWGVGLFPSSGVWGVETRRFGTWMFPSSGEGGGRRHLLNWAPCKELNSITVTVKG
jgi:hypothetical protein